MFHTLFQNLPSYSLDLVSFTHLQTLFYQIYSLDLISLTHAPTDTVVSGLEHTMIVSF